MKHYEDVNVNVIVVLVNHNVVYMVYVLYVQQLVVVLMVDDNNEWFLLIDHVFLLNLYLIHVEYVQFFHQSFHDFYHILIVQNNHDENTVHNHVLVVVMVNVIVIVIVNMNMILIVVVHIYMMIVQSMDNIIHNNQGMIFLSMMKHDDVQHVEQVVYLRQKKTILKNIFLIQNKPSCNSVFSFSSVLVVKLYFG